MDINSFPAKFTPENRPWTRWWWLGSALNESEITRHLMFFRDANIGGVEISPIYGAKGSEERWIEFLSPRWVDLLGFTVREARRLGMGVDLIAGTGWPYGGPWVGDSDAAKRYVWKVVSAAEITVNETDPDAGMIAQIQRDGLISKAAERDFRLVASSEADPNGDILALFLTPTKQQVKRAAPGGEGNVLDHYSGDAVARYFDFFKQKMARLPKHDRVRCFFNDSWEVFGANATPDLFDEWRQRRGYDPAPYLRALHGEGDPDLVQRIRSDYRETIADIVHDKFLGEFNAFAHEQGSKTRNQSHGSPGNLLDLYGAVDIPETEVFGPIRMTHSGLTSPRPVTPDFDADGEELLVCKMASSAAHVMGKPLCSSESFTWLGEHGCVSLSHAKAEVDLLLVMGINHIFFHGTPLSPADAPWPGWLFYASTHCAPTNSWWQDFGALNAYITRCQTALQGALPDNDLLVYLPFYDLLASENGAADELQFMSFHRTKDWLRGSLPEFCAAARALWKNGWGFDFVSDLQLAKDIAADGAGLKSRGDSRYKVLLIAGCERMPPETMERIGALAAEGATVLFLGDLPVDVPGLSDLPDRRERFVGALSALAAPIRAGNLHLGQELRPLLDAALVSREALADYGLEYIRRLKPEGGWVYFVSNPTASDVDVTIPLSVPSARSVLILDPMTGVSGAADIAVASNGKSDVRIAILAGASLFMEAFPKAVDAPSWDYRKPDASAGITLDSKWNVAFIEGGPTLPAARVIPELSDWTTWDADDSAALRAFSGVARYTHIFDIPATTSSDKWSLELGETLHSARVRLNGTDLGTVFARPWSVPVSSDLLRTSGNTLEIEVTNLMANRLSDLERREGETWRPFLMVDIRYKGFDADAWEPLPSGLLGPVRLLPLH